MSCHGSYVIILESTGDASTRQTLPSTQLHAAPIMPSTFMVTSCAFAMRAPLPHPRSTSSGETVLVRPTSTDESPGMSSQHRETQLRKRFVASHLVGEVDILELLRERRADVVRGTSFDRDAIVDLCAEDPARREVFNSTERS